MPFSISPDVAADWPDIEADKPVFGSLQAAAKRWDVSVDTLRRLVSAGKIPAYRLNNRIIRVRLADVDACFEPVASASTGGVR